MKNVVIGLAGVKTSGKDTVSNMIKSLITDAGNSALADKLKNVSADVFGLKRVQFDSQNLKEVPFDQPIKLTMQHVEQVLAQFGVELTDTLKTLYQTSVVGMDLDSPRKIAQIVGTEILRSTGNENIHCDNVQIHDGVTIITDIRFPNEYEYFTNKRDVKFLPLYIHRQVAEYLVTEDSHPSEKLVFTFADKCIKIDNDGDFVNTYKQVVSIILDFIKGC